MNNSIIIRSVYGKVGIIYTLNPCIDPKTGQLPSCVKKVDSKGDMILSEKEKHDLAEGKVYFISEVAEIEVEDGKEFNLDNPLHNAQWEAIKNSRLIAQDRFQLDGEGNPIIEGTKNRFGLAELYIEKAGEEAAQKNKRRKLINKAQTYIFSDSSANQVTKCKLLGKNMKNAHPSDVEDYLVEIANKTPQKIIDLYEGTSTALRILLSDALESGTIVVKNGVYMYGDTLAIGVTDDAVIEWMKQQGNKKILDAIKKQTYPEL